MLLELKKLYVKGDGKEILKGVDLKLEPGQIQALLGPNASGKSTLAQVILGNPKYKVASGKIIFEGKNITNIAPEKRVKLGMALTWQSPPAIKGLKLSQLLDKISVKNPEIFDGKDLLDREVNLDFSGGEKKISELLQVLALEPKLLILDEIDSGLDIKRLEMVGRLLKGEFTRKKISILLITHSGDILNFLKPEKTSLIFEGKIICCSQDYKKILQTIKKHGYEKCKKCKLPAGRP